MEPIEIRRALLQVNSLRFSQVLLDHGEGRTRHAIELETPSWSIRFDRNGPRFRRSGTCTGFIDTNASALSLGATEGASAADALYCAGVVSGFFETCPANLDTKTGEPLCPEQARTTIHVGERLMCGTCLATRAEHLSFGIKAIVREQVVAELEGCASESRCEGWKLCKEAHQGALGPTDWESDLIGWAIAPGREFFRGDGGPAPEEIRTCRPHDAVLWIEAATFFARLTSLPESMRRDDVISFDTSFSTLREKLKSGCRFEGVSQGNQWWIPAAVALNDAGIYCMPTTTDGLRTANICGTERIGDCHATRYVLATAVARIRGDIPLAACDPIPEHMLRCGDADVD